MNIDWSKAPSSATHVRPESDGKCELWLKQVQGEWFFTMTGRSFWARLNDAFKDFSVLIERPAWSGPEDGLPPVGTVCEVRVGYLEQPYKYAECEIIAHFDGESQRCAAYVQTIHDGSRIVGQGIAEAFRPLRTHEQIAAEERDKAIKEMAEELGIMHTTAAQAYDKGYRKVDS